MKKLVLSILFVSLFMGGCSSNDKKEEKKSTVCEVNISGSALEMEIVPDGKKLDEIIVSVKQEGIVAGVSSMEREAGAKEIKNQFGDYKGVTLDVLFEGDDLILKVAMEVSKVEEFPPMLGMESVSVKDLRTTPYETYVKNLESNGATCKEK